MEIELNPKQADFLEGIMAFPEKGKKKAVFMGGRACGKSQTLAHLLKFILEELPRGKTQFACVAVRQAKRVFTGSIKNVWKESWGCYPYNSETGEGEYVLFEEPPKHFDRPFFEPDDWSNCITHVRGHCIEFCGYLHDPDSNRGRNDDVLIIDEALRFKREWQKISEPSIRANVEKFSSPLHHLTAYFTSPPYTSEGDYFWETEKMAAKYPKKYLFVHAGTIDNEMFLPEGFIESQRESLLEIEFNVEILGQKATRVSNSFYTAFSITKHTVLSDKDGEWYNQRLPINISLDFNSSFTCATAWQEYNSLHKCFDNIFVKEAKGGMTMAETWATEYARRYDKHERKVVVITGDRNGLSRSAGSKTDMRGQVITMYDQVEKILTTAGWKVIMEPLTFNPFKDKVYKQMHRVMSEATPGIRLRLHPEQAKQTITSVIYTPITSDFTKDKRSERKAQAQESATHLSDTLDYYVAWVEHRHKGGGFNFKFI